MKFEGWVRYIGVFTFTFLMPLGAFADGENSPVISWLKYEILKEDPENPQLRINLYDGSLDKVMKIDSPFVSCVTKIDQYEIQREICELRLSKSGFEKVQEIKVDDAMVRELGDTSHGVTTIKPLDKKLRLRFKGDVAHLMLRLFEGKSELSTKRPKFKDREEARTDSIQCKWFISRGPGKPIGYPVMLCETILNEDGTFQRP